MNIKRKLFEKIRSLVDLLEVGKSFLPEVLSKESCQKEGGGVDQQNSPFFWNAPKGGTHEEVYKMLEEAGVTQTTLREFIKFLEKKKRDEGAESLFAGGCRFYWISRDPLVGTSVILEKRDDAKIIMRASSDGGLKPERVEKDDRFVVRQK